MNRRQFLSRSAGFAAPFFAPSGDAIRLTLNPAKPVTAAIPPNFIGLGYEISSVARTGLLSASNRSYVELVRGLGSKGVIRIGGNTSDYSKFSVAGVATPAAKATVINGQNLRELGSFLEATGWDLIWGLNLGRGTEQEAVEEARAVAAAARHHLFAFEIGNEPDLFGNRATHRPTGYAYKDFLLDYRRYKTAIGRELPESAFAVPFVDRDTNWVAQFAADEGHDLKLLTHHYYRECANPTSTLDKLLHDDPKLPRQLEQLAAASAASHLPYRICETNSFCGGGKPGVSDTFGAALWVLDFMFKLASAGAGGVNMETGVNQLDFISSYSPIRDDDPLQCRAAPEYFGMLAFSRASRGRVITIDYNPGSINGAAYAVENGPRQITATIINKDAQAADLVVSTPSSIRRASASRLTALSLESKDDVELSSRKPLTVRKGECRVQVPAASAVIVVLELAV
jgi:hypothetical protein